MMKRNTIVAWIFPLMMSFSIQPGCASGPGALPLETPPEGVSTRATPARAILDRLEKAGQKYTTLRAEVEYRVEDRMTGDEELRTGWVAYQKQTAKTPAKFRVSFEKLALGSGPRRKSKQDYIFDGQWLTIAKHRIKSMTKIQVSAKGEKIQALQIGKGPFPVPFGQKTREVLKYLDATVTPRPGQAHRSVPANTDYIRLTPRKGHRKDVNFRSLEMWVDRSSALPVKIRSYEAGRKITTVLFRHIQTRTTIAPELFIMPKPPGWDLTVERLE